MSLRHKLLLLLTGLTLVAVVVSMAVAYGEVRQSSRMAAEERLGRVVDQLAGIAQASTAERFRLLTEVGDDPVLRAALRGGALDSADIVDALDELRTPADSGLAVRLVDREGQDVFTDLPGAWPAAAPEPVLDTVPSFGQLRRVGDEVRYWSTAPVRAADGSTLGWTVQERRIGSPETARNLQDLIGTGTLVAFALPGESLAVTIAGEGMPAPRGFEGDSLFTLVRNDSTFLARAGAVPGAPWRIVVEIPEALVEARAAVFLNHMVTLALLLVLGTVLVAYALGRRLTGPIEELVVATEAVARGDFTEELPTTRGGDELDRLARSFNEMTARVAASREELEERLVQERALTEELEETSARAEAAREEAQRANRAKSEFLATMSHEVRTPINAILGYCDILDMGIPGPLTEDQREKVDRIRRSSRILQSLVEDVLDFAKLDSGRLKVETCAAPVRESVLAASAVLEPQAQRGGLSLEIDVPPGLRFLGDPSRVEQILVNLLSNAVKFTDRGGVVVRAATGNGAHDAPPREGSREPEVGWIRVEVEDTGPGIPEDQMERVFEPFVQGDSGFTRSHGGTGLGLSISRELALMMDGDLTARSRAGEGSCFTLWLPAVPDDDPSPGGDGDPSRQ